MSRIPRACSVPLVTNLFSAAIWGRAKQSRPDMPFDTSVASDLRLNIRRYVPGEIERILHPYQRVVPSSLRFSRYLVAYQYKPCGCQLHNILAIFWLRISSSFTTLSIIFLLPSSMTSTFHYGDHSAILSGQLGLGVNTSPLVIFLIAWMMARGRPH